MNLARLVLLVLIVSSVGCTSPEATRSRGGGPGADVGNRTQFLEMHEGARPFYRTPDLIPAKHPSLKGARQADELSTE